MPWKCVRRTPRAKGLLSAHIKARSQADPPRADLGRKSGWVGVGVTGRTPTCPGGGMFFP